MRTQVLLLLAEARGGLAKHRSSKSGCIKMMCVCVYTHVYNRFSLCFSPYQLVAVAFLYGTSPTCSLLLTVGVVLLSVFALCVTWSHAARVIAGSHLLLRAALTSHPQRQQNSSTIILHFKVKEYLSQPQVLTEYTHQSNRSLPFIPEAMYYYWQYIISSIWVGFILTMHDSCF